MFNTLYCSVFLNVWLTILTQNETNLLLHKVFYLIGHLVLYTEEAHKCMD